MTNRNNESVMTKSVPRFGFRKLTVGLAGVALTTALALANPTTTEVKADTVPDDPDAVDTQPTGEKAAQAELNAAKQATPVKAATQHAAVALSARNAKAQTRDYVPDNPVSTQRQSVNQQTNTANNYQPQANQTNGSNVVTGNQAANTGSSIAKQSNITDNNSTPNITSSKLPKARKSTFSSLTDTVPDITSDKDTQNVPGTNNNSVDTYATESDASDPAHNKYINRTITWRVKRKDGTFKEITHVVQTARFGQLWESSDGGANKTYTPWESDSRRVKFDPYTNAKMLEELKDSIGVGAGHITQEDYDSIAAMFDGTKYTVSSDGAPQSEPIGPLSSDTNYDITLTPKDVPDDQMRDAVVHYRYDSWDSGKEVFPDKNRKIAATVDTDPDGTEHLKYDKDAFNQDIIAKDGYKATVVKTNVQGGTIHAWIVYVKNPANETVIHFIDQDNGNKPIDKVSDVTVNNIIGKPIDKPASVDSILDQLDKLGYEVVSNPFDTPTNAIDGKQELNYVLKHKKVAVSPTTSRTETVHFVDEQGNQLAPDNVQSASFTHNGTKDLVTGETTWTGWSANQNTQAVNVPAIAGYTPETTQVPSQVLTPDKDIEITVKYRKVAAPTQNTSLGVIVHDDDTNQDLNDYHWSSGTVNVGDKVGYDWATAKQNLIDHGYVVVQEPNIPSSYGSSPQVITVHVKHGQVHVNPDKPQTPGGKINKGDAKWPDKSEYERYRKYTVHFVDKHGRKLAPDLEQTMRFGRDLIIDTVTGKVLNPDAKWTPQYPKYAGIQALKIDGYKVEGTSLSGVALVDGVLPGATAVDSDLSDSIVYDVDDQVPNDPGNGGIGKGKPNNNLGNAPKQPAAKVPNQTAAKAPAPLAAKQPTPSQPKVQKASVLPQTGSANTKGQEAAYGLIGIAMFLLSLGFAPKKRKE